MGILDVFGGGGDANIQQASTLRPLQTDFLDAITQQLLNQFQGGQLQGVTPFQGQRVAGISPLQQQAFGLAGGLGQGIQGGLGAFAGGLGQFDPAQGQGFLNRAQGAIQQGLDFDPTEDILSALEPGRQLALRTFNRDVIPDLAERFGASSGASGAFNRAITEAGAGLSLGLNAQAAPFLGQAALNRPGQQFQGAGQLAGLSQLPGQLGLQASQLGGQATDILTQLLNIGGGQRGIEQQGLTAEQQRFAEAQPFNNPFIQGLSQLALGTRAFENIVTPPSQGLFQSLAPSLGAFAGTEAGAGTLTGLAGGVQDFISNLFKPTFTG